MADIVLKCKDCSKEFVWTEGEQDFYKQKQLSAPIRCKDCRAAKKARSFDRGNSRDRRY